MSFVLQPGEGRRSLIAGNDLSSKVVSEDTDGALWVAEYVMEPGFSPPPPHIHNKMQEIFYVLNGILAMRVGEQTSEISAGGLVLVSPGTVHAPSNPSSQATKMLIICTPGGLEGYFAELPDLVARHGWPPPPKEIAALGAKYDTVFLSPAGYSG